MYYHLTDQELRTLETELANIKNAIRELEFLDGEDGIKRDKKND